MKIVAVIPARMASTRYPGKPLLEFYGLPMIEHVRRRTLLCRGFTDVVVATCDREIVSEVRRFGGRAIMTSDKHPVASERVLEAIQEIDCTHVVNVQGDEILVKPADLETMLSEMESGGETGMWNGVAPLESPDNLRDASIVKAVLDRERRFLYCSRQFERAESVHWVMGLLAYERDFLKNFSRWKKTPREEAESIEQMRVLENGKTIQGVLFDKAYPGINEPREAEWVREILENDPEQKRILKEILK